MPAAAKRPCNLTTPMPRGPQPVTVEAIKRVYEERGIVFFSEGPSPNGGIGVRLAE
jgi:hypothetical protein